MPTVLLIEDDELFREALADALTEHGYIVSQAADSEQGMRQFRAEPTRVVITDTLAPNQGGATAVAALHREFPGVGIIAISGGAAHELELYPPIVGTPGVTRTLKKPFGLPMLLAALEEVLAATGKSKAAP